MRRSKSLSSLNNYPVIGATAANPKDDLRKFDFRQWVYVNEFDPLNAFIYKKAYLRICGAHFDLNRFEDVQRHISNYSL